MMMSGFLLSELYHGSILICKALTQAYQTSTKVESTGREAAPL